VAGRVPRKATLGDGAPPTSEHDRLARIGVDRTKNRAVVRMAGSVGRCGAGIGRPRCAPVYVVASLRWATSASTVRSGGGPVPHRCHSRHGDGGAGTRVGSGSEVEIRFSPKAWGWRGTVKHASGARGEFLAELRRGSSRRGRYMLHAHRL
jgi:hypothetical protein